MSLGFIIVLIAAFGLGVQRIFSRTNFGVYITSVSFLLMGVILGPHGLKVLSPPAMASLQPVVTLLMGMLGFILGLPLTQAVRVSRFAPTAIWASLSIGAAIGGGTWISLHWLFSSLAGKTDQLWMSIAVGAAAIAVSTPMVYYKIHRLHTSGPVSESLFAWSVVSNIIAVLVAGGGLAVSRALATDGGAMLTKTEWLVACAGIGIVCGILYTLFLGKGAEESKDRTFLATVAIVVFASGLAAAMGVSPLLVNLFAGVSTSVLYRKTDRLYSVLQGLFEPAATVLAVLAGAMWSPPALSGWILAGGYLLLRFIAATAVGEVASTLADPRIHVSRLGTGIWSQGILAIAVAVNYIQVNPELSATVLTIVLSAVFAGDLMSPYFLKKLLVDSGETPTALLESPDKNWKNDSSSSPENTQANSNADSNADSEAIP